MSEPSFSFGEKWHGRCFICQTQYDKYTTDQSLCKVCINSYRGHKFFKQLFDIESCFATIIPEPRQIPSEMLKQGYNDVLLRSEENNADSRDLFKEFFSQRLPLPCGQPALFEVPHLAKFSGFGQVHTLDLSPYLWSGTLKDLRSWGVLSMAIENDIKNLCLWTAGNAGYSLAKLVHRWNSIASNKKDARIVYCLMDALAPSEIVVTLRTLQCRVAPISTGSGAILSREQLYHVFASLTKKDDNYWQVTDGWDGIGIFMYSLLAQQCIYFLRQKLQKVPGLEKAPIYIILPLGTGNLLLGFVQGRKRSEENEVKIVAAVPFDDHMMMPFLPVSNGGGEAAMMRRVEPEAPKLTGFYSPLSPCLWHLAQNRNFADFGAVYSVEVDRASQIEAATRVLGPTEAMAIAAEPSALIAFGALKQLSHYVRSQGRGSEKSVALVVNSGFGLLGLKEQEFYAKSIFAFR